MLNLKGNLPMAAIITNGALEKLGLKEGMKACTIIKATYVTVGVE